MPAIERPHFFGDIGAVSGELAPFVDIQPQLARMSMPELFADCHERNPDPIKAAEEFIGLGLRIEAERVLSAMLAIAQENNIPIDPLAAMGAWSHESIVTGKMIQAMAGGGWRERLMGPDPRVSTDDAHLIVMEAIGAGYPLTHQFSSQGVVVNTIVSRYYLDQVAGLPYVTAYESLAQALAETTGESRVIILTITANYLNGTLDYLLEEAKDSISTSGLTQTGGVVLCLGDGYYQDTLKKYGKFEGSPLRFFSGGTSNGTLGSGSEGDRVFGFADGTFFMVDGGKSGESDVAFDPLRSFLCAIVDRETAVVGGPGASHLIAGMRDVFGSTVMEFTARVVTYWKNDLGWSWEQVLDGMQQLQGSKVAGCYLINYLVYAMKNGMLPIGNSAIRWKMCQLVNEASQLGRPLPLAGDALHRWIRSGYDGQGTPEQFILTMMTPFVSPMRQ
jgi:6-phosphogluconate dehydrogenase (decarboxylating)